MGEMQGGDPSQYEGYEEAVEFRLVLGIAESLRAEFVVGIDAHPGGEGNEAGVVNRAFRATVRVILQTIVTPKGDVPLVLAWTLRLAALRRLTELGVSGEQAESLLDSESNLGDRWFAYLTLAPSGVVNDLTDGGHVGLP